MFDTVYSVSVFSHLDMEYQRLWLDELARITKRRGYCFLTTEGFTALSALHEADLGTSTVHLEEDLSRRGWIHSEYRDLAENLKHQATMKGASSMVGVERGYGNMVLSPTYIRENLRRERRRRDHRPSPRFGGSAEDVAGHQTRFPTAAQ
jgi:hypothetical protein